MKKKYLILHYLSVCITCNLIAQRRNERDGIMKLCPSGGKQNWKKDVYRPLSIIEMMHYCCNVGCKIKNLLPYCDPFAN
uniref:Insulin-like domain-containing protein n=1 Tax=Wuchereria bancrofti TaxID=6293 RepID=A0A1I8ECT7_WUCBA